MSDFRVVALAQAIAFHDHPEATSTDVITTANLFFDFLSGGGQPDTKPATTRRKAADKPDDSATSNKQSLEPANEATAEAGDTSSNTDTDTSTSSTATTGASRSKDVVSRDDMMAAATLFTQGPAGADGLAAVLKQLGDYERFSAVPEDRYGDFMALLNKPKNPLE